MARTKIKILQMENILQIACVNINVLTFTANIVNILSDHVEILSDHHHTWYLIISVIGFQFV